MWWMGLVVAAWAGEPGGFDHSYADFAAALDGAVSTSGVDYDTLAKRRATLDAFLARVAEADASGFTKAESLALYVNAYNGYTVQMILDARPLKSIRDLDGGNPWKSRTFRVAGEAVTLDQMEHQHARKLADGRVHAVVNCASKGCPPLPAKPLVPSTLESDLNRAARTWVRTNAYVVSDGTLALSKIFDWYAEDFVSDKTVDVPEADDKQDAAIAFLKAHGLDPLPAFTKVGWNTYDWSLNAAP